MQFLLSQLLPSSRAIVELPTDDLYRDANNLLYTDSLMESPYTATIDSETEQVVADPSNTVTIGGVTYTKFTASTYDVETEDGEGLVINPENVICKLVDGVPETTNYNVIDPVEAKEYIDYMTNRFLYIDVQSGICYMDIDLTTPAVTTDNNIIKTSIPVPYTTKFDPIVLVTDNGSTVYANKTYQGDIEDTKVYLLCGNNSRPNATNGWVRGIDGEGNQVAIYSTWSPSYHNKPE